MYTPAITKVEECNKLLTGVGAAIALSNHDPQGSMALLLKAAPTSSRANINEILGNPIVVVKSNKNNGILKKGQ